MNRRGFTLIELLVVLTVIAALAGMVLAGGMMLVASSRNQATQTLVDTIAAKIAGHTRLFGMGPGNGSDDATGYFLFDLNGDTMLDGVPEKDFAAQPAILALAQQLNYHGFVAEVNFEHQERRDEAGRVRDLFGFPMHVAYSSVYGTGGVGVWSDGPDGLSNTEDDIRSWGEMEK